MSSEEGAPPIAQQQDRMSAEEWLQEGAQTATLQPEPMDVQEASSLQQPEPRSAEWVVPTAAQGPETMVTNVGAPAAAHQPETKGARDASQEFAQRLEQTGSVSGVRPIFCSYSVPPSLRTLPVHQPPLPQDDIKRSLSGSRSNWIRNATYTTICSTGSLHSNHVRQNGHIHTDGSEDGNGAGRNVPQCGTLRQDTGKPMQPKPSLSTDGASMLPAIQYDEPHGSSSGSAPVSVTTTSSMSSSSSTTSSDSDPTKPDILGSPRSCILETDGEAIDETTLTTPLMEMLDTYSDYFRRVEQPLTDEYIVSKIKRYEDMASTSTTAMHIIVREVFCNFPFQVTEDVVKRSELCASLERSLRAVRDYVRTTSDNTTETAIKEMIHREIIDEVWMGASGVLPEVGVPGSQDRGVQQCGKTYCDSDVTSDCVKEVPMEGISAEETLSPMQTSSGSVTREREVQAAEAVQASSVKTGSTKESERSPTISSSNNNIDRLMYIISRCFQYFYPERNIPRKVDESVQKAAVLKMYSLAQARVSVIRTMNSAMLRCMKMVIAIVNQALMANRVAHRAISETEALRSAGISGHYIAALAEGAAIATHSADTAVRKIEEAAQLHKSVVDALYLAERALFIVKTETCNGVDLLLHLILGVELIELKVTQSCRTYLDKANSSDSGSSDVFHALMWACYSSVNAVETIEKVLQVFLIAKQRKLRGFDKN